MLRSFPGASLSDSVFRHWPKLQLVLCLSLAAASAVCSLGAYQAYSRAALDGSAERELAKIRDEIYGMRAPQGENLLLQAYGADAANRLPGPFQSIEIASDSVLEAFVYVKRRHGVILMIALRKQGGRTLLWSDFFGNRRLQRLEARA